MSVQVYLKIKIEIEKQFIFNGYNYLKFPYKKKPNKQVYAWSKKRNNEI